jgi:hypothetical protein
LLTRKNRRRSERERDGEQNQRREKGYPSKIFLIVRVLKVVVHRPLLQLGFE